MYHPNDLRMPAFRKLNGMFAIKHTEPHSIQKGAHSRWSFGYIELFGLKSVLFLPRTKVGPINNHIFIFCCIACYLKHPSHSRLIFFHCITHNVNDERIRFLAELQVSFYIDRYMKRFVFFFFFFGVRALLNNQSLKTQISNYTF